MIFINGEKLVGNIPFDKLSRGLDNMLDEIARDGSDMTRLAPSGETARYVGNN